MDTPSETPRVNAHVNAASAVFKTVDGRSEVLEAEGDALRDVVVDRATAEARELGSPVELVTSGERGDHRILITVDGALSAADDDTVPTRSVLRERAWWITGPPPPVEESGPADAESAGEDAAPAAAEPPFAVLSDLPPAVFPDLSDLSPTASDRVETPDEDDEEPDIFQLLGTDPATDEPEVEDPFDAADTVVRAPAVEAPAPVEVPPLIDSVAVGSLATPEPVEIEPAAAADAVEPAAAAETAEVTERPEFSLPQPLPDNAYTGPHAVEAAPDTEQTARPSFITPTVGQPAPITGWRGFLARIGLPVKPSRAQIERAGWEQDVSLQWAGCRTIAVANGKGGVGKTMTTAMLAAVFARHGGGNVLAWDNNDTRGTLGWRTEQGLYDTTLRDLLPEAGRLLEPTSSVSEIARFVHHQATDRYDVLRSNPELLAMDQRIATADFDLLMQVAARYYRLVIFDSGNDESADRWLRMIDSSYQLVVPTLAAPESAESAALLLDALRRRDEHSKRLADEATVIVTQSERSSLAAVSAIAEKFAGHVRAVEIIPFDHGLKSGPLRFDGLQSATRDAWVRAAAAVARGL